MPDCGDVLIVGSILRRGSREFKKLLVQRSRMGPHGDGATALHLAAAHGYLDICRDILDADADPNAFDRKHHMPLHRAAHGDHVETASLLVTFAANVSGCERGSDTPLHVASLHGNLPMAQMLARYAADVDATRHDGVRPLHLAAEGGHGAICLLLLGCRACPDGGGDAAETPFMLAFKKARPQCCRALLDAGALFPAVESPRWSPPFTEFDPNEHARLWNSSDPEDGDLSRLFSC